ncbi:MAG: hypothetical protein AMS18_08800 [Gemmatimonas sp. SG8_17]|nr:MAG: hypothetical protein AMS18_08800 [Gemmatimonas sp. SG8_17]
MSRKAIIRVALLAALAGLGTITGCSSTSQGVSADFEFTPDDSHGLMVVSTRWISPTKRPGFGPHVRRNPARNLDEKMGTVLNVHNAFIEPDFTNPPGYFYVMKFKPGTYEIISNELKENLRFEVEAGKAVYIGELEFRQVLGCLDFNAKGCVPDVYSHVVYTVRDEWERDEPLLRKRLTHYPAGGVMVRLATPVL